jgi:hypothetical protein
MTATARATKPSPDIAEDIVICPPAGRLTLSSRHPKKEHTDHEREARLNAEAQARWKNRNYDVYPDGRPNKNKSKKRTCCTTEYDGDILDMLVGLGRIEDGETDDPRIVGEAISEMMAELARNWKADRRG